ncbi:MAG TPA: DUF4157 domain-containing protein [Pyrinomonadaceae bacterium]|nr:DUF4157 domain-containing protein [Pyrinomonadaceae bacterium]
MYAYAQAREELYARPNKAIQAKSPLSSPGDAHEQEADRFADAFVGGRDAPTLRHQASCACGGGCPRCRGGESSASSTPSASGASGERLPDSTRSLFEPRFGRDFGDVRVHTGARAASSARDAQALAYTKGKEIVFGAGAYRPETTEGRRLIAHELAHVAQQADGRAPRGAIQRQPDPQATPPTTTTTPGLSLRPQPYYLELKNPWTDTQANVSAYDTTAAALAFGFEQLGKQYPTLNRLWVLRLAEMSASGLLLTGLMTYTHEMGHYREAERFGWDPQIEMYAPWSGATKYPGQPLNPPLEQLMTVSTAGVNQEQLNASYIYSRWGLNRDVRYQEAAAYFLAQTNLFFYSMRTAYKVAEGTVEEKDDIFQYTDPTRNPNAGWKLREVIIASAVSNLFSAPVLSSLGNSIAYLWTGRRRVGMPSFKAFGAEVAWPHFQMLLTTKGVTLGGRTVVDFGKGWRAEFTVDTLMPTPDEVSGVAVGGKLHDIPVMSKLTPKLHVSPFVRGTLAEGTGGGYYLGADISYDLLPQVGISARIGYREDDLLSEPEGKPGEGLEGSLGVTGRF